MSPSSLDFLETYSWQQILGMSSAWIFFFYALRKALPVYIKSCVEEGNRRENRRDQPVESAPLLDSERT
jgi:hypothetical protein